MSLEGFPIVEELVLALLLIFLHKAGVGVLSVGDAGGQAAAEVGQNVAGPEDELGDFVFCQSFR